MSRGTVVAMLVAAEVAIVGMALYAVGGHASLASGMHQAAFTAAPIAPISVGAQSHVVIDDAQSRILVGTSTDGLVHVRDLTEMRGAVFSNQPYPRLNVARTPDGVLVERPHVARLSIEIFGFVRQRIAVDVPPDARLEIARCSGADVDGVTGGVSVHSVDGHVTLSDLQGAVDASSDDGYVSAKNVRGDRLSIESRDGHLALDDVAVATLSGTTRDGRIEAAGLSVTHDATLQTGDGSVRVHLAPDSNVTVDASTRDGHVAVNGDSSDGSDSSQRTVRVGTGAGHMKLSTDSGSIRIFTNGESLDNGL